MKRLFRISIFSAFLTALSFVISSNAAHAQGGPVDIQMFRPAMDSKGILSVETTQVLKPGMFSVGLTANYSYKPLVLKGDLDGGDDRIFQIKHLTSANLQFAIGLFKIKDMPFMELGFGIPIHIVAGNTDPYTTNGDYPWDQYPSTNNPGVQAPLGYEDNGNFSSDGLGDIYLNMKMRFMSAMKSPVGLGTVISVGFPSSKVGGGDETFLGTGGFSVWPRFVMDTFLDKKNKLLFSLNVGARLRFGNKTELTPNPGWDNCNPSPPAGSSTCTFDGNADNARVLNLAWQHHVTIGLGLAWTLVDQKIDWVTELYGAMELTSLGKGDDYYKRVFPFEALTGLKVYLATNSYLALAGGVGLTGIGPTNAAGAPDFRLLASFTFEPLMIMKKDDEGIRDTDGDGIPDHLDRCPNEPGPRSNHGCPVKEELDRDGDGIPDHLDKCPDEPEDYDGFEDSDGCPEYDNDGDGIPDKEDDCPGTDADKHNDFARTWGLEKNKGCPVADRDGDGICDPEDHIQKHVDMWDADGVCKAKDMCPDVPAPGTKDGCPEKRQVVVEKDRLLILEKIYFETAKAIIKKVSYNILDAIASTLQSNPNIELVEIQGHADERGSDSYNMRLTDDRAHAVLRYLVNKGVSRSRLQAKGYGSRQPVCHKSNEECWSQNRRVEFVIKRRKADDDDF